MEFNGYILREGKPGDRQRKIIERLKNREILPTRSVRNSSCGSAICEAPLDSNWSVEVFSFWQRLSNTSINSFEGILASTIHNPTIRVFKYLLACTIFGRENPNKVNARELLFLQGSLTNRRINSVPFMIAHMDLTLNKVGPIIFGGLITSIARALNLNNDIATLVPLAPRTINLKFMRDMKLCRVRREGGYVLMIHGIAILFVALPCTRRTDIHNERNWTYVLDAPPILDPLPPNVPDEERHDTDGEFDRRGKSPVPHVSPHHPSPPYTAPSSSFAGNLRGLRTTQAALSARMDQRDHRRSISRRPSQDGEGTNDFHSNRSLDREKEPKSAFYTCGSHCGWRHGPSHDVSQSQPLLNCHTSHDLHLGVSLYSYGGGHDVMAGATIPPNFKLRGILVIFLFFLPINRALISLV
ncbi:hypothetical protein KIW84_064802 [Lathyrus oleraceus]|uniref:Uncharacterized protein n=1 Tax=Pisum sativum TaxID=3888 RepID=A0A9D4WDA0_PEA|nr:hypothetical protein KIW84_064802 [Pisum sativum]